MGPTGATLSGSFSGATGRIYEAGFEYATSEDALDGDGDKIYDDTCVGSVASGTISATLGSLSPSTTYYYRAFVREYNESTSSYEYRPGDVSNFTTAAAEAYIPAGWLELPAVTGSEDYVGEFYGSGSHVASNRNYSYNYSFSRLGCLWVAYPLTSSHLSGSASSGWALNPDVPEDKQINKMFSNSYPSNFEDADDYSKGHQIPNADRYSDGTMNAQTYYITNQTPQIANSFNNGVWGNLEGAVRGLVSSTVSADSVYVVTGACYQTVGSDETVSVLTAKSTSSVTPKSVPVPNYYWKAILKVKWEGNMVTDAQAIGFWFPHEATSKTYTQFATSVNEIERLTGFDLFANLPGDNSSGIEAAAEANESWTAFQNF